MTDTVIKVKDGNIFLLGTTIELLLLFMYNKELLGNWTWECFLGQLASTPLTVS